MDSNKSEGNTFWLEMCIDHQIHQQCIWWSIHMDGESVSGVGNSGTGEDGSD